LKKINDLVVAAGQKLEPQAIEAVRGDTFVVETNIHYPTESSLSGDGLRKVVTWAAALAALHGHPGWRQRGQLLKIVKALMRDSGRAARGSTPIDNVRPR
jgi:transposase, IS5 family